MPPTDGSPADCPCVSRSGPAIGIAGGSGSGKTTLVDAFIRHHSGSITLLSQDFYYFDRSSLSIEERARTNFDCPDSIDFDRMARNLDELRAGRPVNVPIYDFHEHVRTGERSLSPGDILLVEGTLILAVEAIRSRLDCAVFLDAPDSIRLERRIRRDRAKRGRREDDILRQYRETVRPMYGRWIAPTRGLADGVIDGTLPVEKMTERFIQCIAPFLSMA